VTTILIALVVIALLVWILIKYGSLRERLDISEANDAILRRIIKDKQDTLDAIKNMSDSDLNKHL